MRRIASRLALVLLLAGSVGLACEDGAPAKERKRSVLFYLIDTCRADRLSLYGNDRKTTPFLDSLAERSVVFERCYAQAPWTKPSMASILTSRYPSETGVTRMFQQMSSSYLTLPEAFHKGGYFTKGLSANPLMGGMSNYAQGFDEFLESADVNHANPIRYASGSAEVLNEHLFPWLEPTNPWPMFLYLHSVDPHEEYEPAPAYLEKFADPGRMERYREEWRALVKTRPPVPGNHVTRSNFERAGVEIDPFIRQGMALYDADVLANDVALERLYARLMKAGWGDDVILVITSDHGEEFFEHGGTSHGYSLYGELLHVPLLIHAPGLLPGGKRIREPVQSIDIYPTLLELAGLEVPSDIAGRSLVPLIRSLESWEPRPVFSENTEDPGSRRMGVPAGVALSMIDGRWKLTMNFRSPVDRELPRYELYDLERDPFEQLNLADKNPERVATMEQEMMKWRATRLARGTGEASEVAPEAVDPAILERLKRLGYLK